MINIVKRITLKWPDIIGGEVLLQTPLGTEYEVSEVGRIWVSPTDLNEAVAKGGGVVCDLVSTPDENSQKTVWAIVRLQAAAPDPAT